MLLSKERLDFDQQLLLHHVGDEDAALGGDLLDEVLVLDVVEAPGPDDLPGVQLELLPPARLCEPRPQVLLEPLLLPGLHRFLLCSIVVFSAESILLITKSAVFKTELNECLVFRWIDIDLD